jgi:hypothetical protein
MNQLIHCINCHAVFLKTPFDRGEEYPLGSFEPLENFRATRRDDFEDFLRSHRGHRLEDLRVVEDSFISEKPYFEPVKASYFKATNGKESFVIKKSRESIDEPLRYQLIVGDYSLKCAYVEIQSEEITKQLARECKETPLPSKKISEFLRLLKHIAETIDVRNLDRIAEESPYPLEVYHKMDDFSLTYLLRNCRHIFNEHEYSAMEAFIHRHKEDGVLLLRAIYEIEIFEKVQPVKKVMAPSIPSEKRKIVGKI